MVRMRNFRRFQLGVVAIVCLGFTGGDVAWADPLSPAAVADEMVPTAPAATPEELVPLAPRASWGSTVRFGTAVGRVHGPESVVALGLTAAMGQRFGRLGIEAEYTYLDLMQYARYQTALGITDGNVSVGNGQRLAALARLDVLRFGPVDDRHRPLITLYVEGGAAVAWNRWTRPLAGDSMQLLPSDTKRTEGQAGFGVMFFPHNVAWLLGWRMAFSPHEPMTGTICRGTSCRPVTMTDQDQRAYVDRSMLFQSSLEFTF
jgi:hypothetical protein